MNDSSVLNETNSLNEITEKNDSKNDSNEQRIEMYLRVAYDIDSVNYIIVHFAIEFVSFPSN